MRILRGLSQGLMLFALVALAVAAGAWALRMSALKKAKEEMLQEQRAIAVTKARKGDFEVVVEAVGTLEAVKSESIAAEVSGQIVRVVPNGICLEKGDVIAEIDFPRKARELRSQTVRYQNLLDEQETQKHNLATQVEKAESELKQMEIELGQFRSNSEAELKEKTAQLNRDTSELALARKRLERKRGLAEEGLVAKQEVEQAAMEIKAKEFDLRRQTKQLEVDKAKKASEELDREAKVAQAQSQLQRAEAAQQDETRNMEMRLGIQEQQLRRVQEELAKAIVRAPNAGIVVLSEQWDGTSQRPLEPGDRVWQGHTIATLPDMSKMRVSLEVPQSRARKIKKKQAARICIEGLPGVTLRGEVTEVAQAAGTEGSRWEANASAEKTFRTEISITDDAGDAPLRPGMTVTVQVVVEKIDGAVTVPLACVFDRDDGKVVYVKKGSRFQEVRVALGSENPDVVVVTKGLKGGEEISLRDIGGGAETSSASREEATLALPL
ncbi:MAG: HlyD family efflux transporter periplasmic adaptor subunit [Armatimonadetes bacterium]|nr:HlyD family efflux transporter periplasmic adaptor subunit [Armatimonadota bacterium]NIM24587.1 HlyD family efflux transporter periplasmic adaptor subunit [Armatimonadota bacterium]NIM68463.1 HlyD family efflux transporter periplasmic adaptor subunit [Armatimonadota bacterium]NIM76849.1 HlyD family efflux transporter periplasmic adaptor subunit [Armatimonadota bacterium]NIN06660.1 HlyD family efflux transporter periplasmic adaptor subunit [Armatimonadota bacterium]